MKNERDPLDESRKVAQREGDDKLAKALVPRQRVGMWVIDRLEEDEGPQFFDAPFTLDKSFVNVSIDEDTGEVVYIDDPKDGCDVRFYREGKGLNTKYDASKMRLMKPSPLHEDESIEAEWLGFVQENPVPECLQFYSYEHIADAYGGMAGTRYEDEAEAPKTSKRATVDDEPKPRRAAPKVEDEEVEPSPPPRRGATSRASEPEDDEPAPPAKTPSIRDRLRQRHAPRGGDEEDAEAE